MGYSKCMEDNEDRWQEENSTVFSGGAYGLGYDSTEKKTWYDFRPEKEREPKSELIIKVPVKTEECMAKTNEEYKPWWATYSYEKIPAAR